MNTSPNSSPSPLDGLRVLDLASLFPAPLLAALLGDYGAEVIKVEPPSGDPLRGLGPQYKGRSLAWAQAGRNKRSVTLNLGDERAQPLLAKLVQSADVLIENFPRDAAKRFGVEYEQLRQLNPRLIVGSLSCYGVTGPYAERGGNGTLSEAYAGLTNMTGEADGPPMLTSAPLGDGLAAVAGLNGILAALYQRDAKGKGGGKGQLVDLTIYEPILQLMAAGVLRHGVGAGDEQRCGSRLPGAAPRNVYAAQGGEWVVISALTDRVVKKLLEIMGKATPDDLQRFGTQAARAVNEDAMDRAVADWVATQPRERVVELLAKARIPVTPVNDMPAIFADPHIQARGNLATLHDPELGELTLPAPSPRLSETPARFRSAAPALGAHNAEVYGPLGFDAAQLAELRAANVI